MAVVNEVMTIINVIMSFALVFLIFISIRQNIRFSRATNASLDILFKRQQLLSEDLDQLQKALIQVQKGEVANAKSINAIARQMTELHDLVIEDQTRQDQDIKALATLISGLKTSSYRSRNDKHFNNALKRIAKLVKE